MHEEEEGQTNSFGRDQMKQFEIEVRSHIQLTLTAFWQFKNRLRCKNCVEIETALERYRKNGETTRKMSKGKAATEKGTQWSRVEMYGKRVSKQKWFGQSLSTNCVDVQYRRRKMMTSSKVEAGPELS